MDELLTRKDSRSESQVVGALLNPLIGFLLRMKRSSFCRSSPFHLLPGSRVIEEVGAKRLCDY